LKMTPLKQRGCRHTRLSNNYEAFLPYHLLHFLRQNRIYYGGFFHDNLTLTDWVNSQRLGFPLVCLGDGHDGIWNLFAQIATPDQRQEILDWYHLKENLYKVGGSLKRLHQAESLLWQGQVEVAKQLFESCSRPQARNFRAYLNKHRHRIVNRYALSYRDLGLWIK